MIPSEWVGLLKPPAVARCAWNSHIAARSRTTPWHAHYADVRIMPTCVGNPACGAGIAAMESA